MEIKTYPERSACVLGSQVLRRHLPVRAVSAGESASRRHVHGPGTALQFNENLCLCQHSYFLFNLILSPCCLLSNYIPLSSTIQNVGHICSWFLKVAIIYMNFREN